MLPRIALRCVALACSAQRQYVGPQQHVLRRLLSSAAAAATEGRDGVSMHATRLQQCFASRDHRALWESFSELRMLRTPLDPPIFVMVLRSCATAIAACRSPDGMVADPLAASTWLRRSKQAVELAERHGAVTNRVAAMAALCHVEAGQCEAAWDFVHPRLLGAGRASPLSTKLREVAMRACVEGVIRGMHSGGEQRRASVSRAPRGGPAVDVHQWLARTTEVLSGWLASHPALQAALTSPLQASDALARVEAGVQRKLVEHGSWLYRHAILARATALDGAGMWQLAKQVRMLALPWDEHLSVAVLAGCATILRSLPHGEAAAVRDLHDAADAATRASAAASASVGDGVVDAPSTGAGGAQEQSVKWPTDARASMRMLRRVASGSARKASGGAGLAGEGSNETPMTDNDELANSVPIGAAAPARATAMSAAAASHAQRASWLSRCDTVLAMVRGVGGNVVPPAVLSAALHAKLAGWDAHGAWTLGQELLSRLDASPPQIEAAADCAWLGATSALRAAQPELARTWANKAVEFARQAGARGVVSSHVLTQTLRACLLGGVAEEAMRLCAAAICAAEGSPSRVELSEPLAQQLLHLLWQRGDPLAAAAVYAHAVGAAPFPHDHLCQRASVLGPAGPSVLPVLAALPARVAGQTGFTAALLQRAAIQSQPDSARVPQPGGRLQHTVSLRGHAVGTLACALLDVLATLDGLWAHPGTASRNAACRFLPALTPQRAQVLHMTSTLSRTRRVTATLRSCARSNSCLVCS